MLDTGLKFMVTIMTHMSDLEVKVMIIKDWMEVVHICSDVRYWSEVYGDYHHPYE